MLTILILPKLLDMGLKGGCILSLNCLPMGALHLYFMVCSLSRLLWSSYLHKFSTKMMYQFVSYQMLPGPKEKLDWRIRYKIALGTARGLLYLHEECQRRIIHKDIKASNILLTEDLEPQVSFETWNLTSYCCNMQHLNDLPLISEFGTSNYFRFQILGLQNGYQRSGLITPYQKLKALLGL